MPATDRRYCIVGIHWADCPDKPEILAIDGQVVVFDTVAVAQNVIPRLGAGRIEHWSADRETLLFSPLCKVGGFNRLSIWTNYDPYDVPNGFRAKGVYSEAEGRDWKHHAYWHHVLPAILAWADDLSVKYDPFAISEIAA
jgi:hypothetical protein